MENSDKPEEKTNETQPAETPAAEGTSTEDSGELSLEKIDAVLAEADPEFAKQMRELAADKEISITEEGPLQNTFLVFVKSITWKISVGLTNFTYDLLVWTGKLLWSALKKFAFVLKTLLVGLRNFFKMLGENFRRLSPTTKRFFYLSLLMSIVLLGALGWFAKSGWFFKNKQLFITTLAERAQEKITFEDSAETEPFYDSLRATPNLLMIQKSVVNIRRSATSGENPMVAVELLVEGYNTEVVTEIKNREGFYRDLIHSTIAKFSYDELDTSEGKRELLGVIQKELNSVVRQGQVKVVRFKTIILKP